MKDCNMTPMGGRYGTWLTETGVWVITTKNVFCYLLIGTEKAMLIDTAYGKGDLRRIVEEITKLPVIVVNTHTHYDHSGGNAFWPEVWAGAGGEKDAVRKKKLPYPNYRLRQLTDGQIFELGGRSVRCLSIGAHHPSSFAFLDEQHRNLFVGDEIDPGQVLLNVRGDSAKTKDILRCNAANMKKLLGIEECYDRIYPAHNGTPISKTYAEDFLTLSEKIRTGGISPCETIAGYGLPPMAFGGDRKSLRYRYGKASFITSK